MSIFSKIKIQRPKRTIHNLSYSSKLSLPFGRLVPIMLDKVVPGDKFIHSHEFLLRFAPFIGQVFQSFQVRVDYFYVPSRLLWKNFEKFLVDDGQDFVHPYLNISDLLDGEHNMTGTLVDYFNLPTVNPSSVAPFYQVIDGSGSNIKIDALPFMAYLKIFLDYYADENLTVGQIADDILDFQTICDGFEELTGYDGDLAVNNLIFNSFELLSYGNISDQRSIADKLLPLHRAYPKDYFTSALPFAQRGPLVQIPLNGSGDVQASVTASGARQNYTNIYADWQAGLTPSEVLVTLRTSGDLSVSSTTYTNNQNLVDGEVIGTRHQIPIFGRDGASTNETVDQVKNGLPITFKAVNINGTATINDLRTAIAVQGWLEKNARAGVRYKEQLLSHFGVRSKDYRLDRAQLLQSSKSTVHIGEIFTTAQNDTSTFIPGLGVSTATGSQAVKPFKRYFDEHGYVLGFMTVFPQASYHQGIPKQFMELDKFDYYWPEFQHIGEQEIKRCELFFDDEGDTNNQTFGYTPRYAQYKTHTPQVHGDFRTSLMYMHDGRSFANSPLLNRDFIDINVEKNNLYRVFNYTEQSPFYNAYPCYCDFFHNFKSIRPMVYHGIPRII